MANFNYYCINCTCGKKETFIIEKEDNTTSLFAIPEGEERCPENDSILKYLGHNMTGGIAKFASSSREGKAAMLKQRSKDHYVKEIKERRHEMDKKTFGRSSFDSKPKK